MLEQEWEVLEILRWEGKRKKVNISFWQQRGLDLSNWKMQPVLFCPSFTWRKINTLMFEVKLRNCWLSIVAEDSTGLFFFLLNRSIQGEASRRKQENERSFFYYFCLDIMLCKSSVWNYNVSHNLLLHLSDFSVCYNLIQEGEKSPTQIILTPLGKWNVSYRITEVGKDLRDHAVQLSTYHQ